jgi:hypothetical protein
MSDTTKECIACAETIKANALLCRYCDTRQDDLSFSTTKKAQSPKLSKEVESKSSPNANLVTLCELCNTFNSKFEKRCLKCQGLLNHVNPSNGTIPTTYSGPQYYQPSPGATTPGIAIAAVIFAFVFPLLGIILGYAARREIRSSGGTKDGDRLATVAIRVSWIVLICAFIYGFVVGLAVGLEHRQEY